LRGIIKMNIDAYKDKCDLLEKEVERLKCCGNCKYFMYCKTDGFIYCEIEVYPFPIKGICGKWQPDGRIFNR